MYILDIIAWLSAIPPFICLTVAGTECLFGLRPIKAPRGKVRGKIAVIVPAHNEGSTLGDSLSRLVAQRPAGARLIVVADNCTDDTASIASAHDVEVLVRNDPALRGKGFALAFAHDHLAADPPDVVIVIDADCAISDGGIEALAAVVMETGEGAQSVNLQFDRSNSGGLVDISNFALLIKNLVRTRGLQRLSGSCALFGTGMALPWRLFRRELLATESIVDDLALTIDLARAGVRCRLVEEAVVSSPSADWGETVKQRRRWEHGFLATGMTKALPLLALGLRRMSRRLCGYGLHLMVPPLALLLLVSTAILGLLTILGALGASWTPAILLFALLAFAGFSLLAAWFAEGRKILPGRSLIRIPIYAMRKIPIYTGLFQSRHSTWTRTRREGEPN